MSTTTGPRRGLKWVSAVLFAAAAIAFVIFFVMALDGPSDPSKASANLGGTTSSSATNTTSTTAVSCPNTGPVKIEQGEHNEIIPGGLPKDDIAAAKAKMLEAAKTNPAFVMGYIMATLGNLGETHKGLSELVKDGCWTPEGYRQSLKVQGSLESGNLAYSTADPTHRNSGSENGQLVVAEEPGISGDLLSVRIDHVNGTFTQVLVRCSNFTFEGDVPEIPRGKTDNPTTPTGQTPAYECPPGQVGTPPDDCAELKRGEQQPENRENIPTQQRPGDQKLTPSPTHAQPVQPVNPPPVRVEPTPPPVTTSPRPAPPSNEEPTITVPPGDPCDVDPHLCDPE